MRWVWLLALYGCRFGFDAIAPGDSAMDALANDGAAVDGALPVGCPPFALLCDDFESGDLSKWTEGMPSAGSSVVVSTVRPRGGAFSLDVTTPVGPATSFANAVLRFPSRATGTLATRHYFNAVSRLGGYDLVIIFRNKATPQYATTGGDSISRWVATEADVNDVLYDHFTAIDTPTANVWTCVELVYTFPVAGPGNIKVYVDDTLVVDVPTDDQTPAFDEIQVGLGRADSPGQRLFVDDVVIATQRIGC